MRTIGNDKRVSREYDVLSRACGNMMSGDVDYGFCKEVESKRGVLRAALCVCGDDVVGGENDWLFCRGFCSWIVGGQKVKSQTISLNRSDQLEGLGLVLGYGKLGLWMWVFFFRV